MKLINSFVLKERVKEHMELNINDRCLNYQAQSVLRICFTVNMKTDISTCPVQISS